MAIMAEQPVRRQRRAGAAHRAPDQPELLVQWFLAPGDLASVPVVRREMVAWLGGQPAQGGDLDAAALVIGEVLANAVEHTTGPAWVSMQWNEGHPQVRVSDSGSGGRPREPRPALPDDELAESGRGLHLATMLALDLQISRSAAGGAVVTATLDLSR